MKGKSLHRVPSPSPRKQPVNDEFMVTTSKTRPGTWCIVVVYILYCNYYNYNNIISNILAETQVSILRSTTDHHFITSTHVAINTLLYLVKLVLAYLHWYVMLAYILPLILLPSAIASCGQYSACQTCVSSPAGGCYWCPTHGGYCKGYLDGVYCVGNDTCSLQCNDRTTEADCTGSPSCSWCAAKMTCDVTGADLDCPTTDAYAVPLMLGLLITVCVGIAMSVFLSLNYSDIHESNYSASTYPPLLASHTVRLKPLVPPAWYECVGIHM